MVEHPAWYKAYKESTYPNDPAEATYPNAEAMAAVNLEDDSSYAEYTHMYDYYVASAKLLAAQTKTPFPAYRMPSEIWWRREVALHVGCEALQCKITVYGMACSANATQRKTYSENFECLTGCLTAKALTPTEYDDSFSLIRRKSPVEYRAHLADAHGVEILADPRPRRARKVHNRCTRLLTRRRERLAKAQQTFAQKMADLYLDACFYIKSFKSLNVLAVCNL